MQHGKDGRFLAVRLSVLTAGAVIALGSVLYFGDRPQLPAPFPSSTGTLPSQSRFYPFGRFGFWWGEVPEEVHAMTRATGTYSNIEPQDYVGAQRCGGCHQQQFQAWSQHTHRLMNAEAIPANVRGDFSANARLGYLGGEGRFWRVGDQFYMSAERGTIQRAYRITRTIGSRFFQYYVGVQTAGPEPPTDDRYRIEHVLPFGYWLRRRQWVPTVHIRGDRAEDSDDPRQNPFEDFTFSDYDRRCSQCHTTLALGDWLLRSPYDAGKFTPYPFSLQLDGYLRGQRRTPLAEEPESATAKDIDNLLRDLVENRLPAPIQRLGIECEACHNGGRSHVARPEEVPPYFFPASPLILARLPDNKPHGRTHANRNWICARCHNGARPLFPGGLSTWNSVEYTDAMRGSCYSKLQCVDCHEPHRSIGPQWPATPADDDLRCLKCHPQFNEAAARRSHTHHPAETEGDRCMNCHMPRLVEGLDQLVRTHTIFSPTKAAPIHENGPNACNLCHLDRPIDWTLRYLKEWYGRSYDERLVAKNYPRRHEPVGQGWLKHPFPATRLVAAASYGRQKRRAALPALLAILDDPYLLNRQFGQVAAESILGQSLQVWNYDFTLSPTERAAVLPRVRQALGE